MRPLLAFLAQRLAGTLAVLTVVAVVVFLLLRLMPGDPAAIIAGDSATTEQIQQIRETWAVLLPSLPSTGIICVN